MLMQDLVQCKDVFVKTIADIRPTSACEAFAVVKLLHTRCPLQFVQMLQLGAGLPPDNAPINAENKKALECSNMILERPQRIQPVTTLHASSGYLCPSSCRKSATSASQALR